MGILLSCLSCHPEPFGFGVAVSKLVIRGFRLLDFGPVYALWATPDMLSTFRPLTFDLKREVLDLLALVSQVSHGLNADLQVEVHVALGDTLV